MIIIVAGLKGKTGTTSRRLGRRLREMGFDAYGTSVRWGKSILGRLHRERGFRHPRDGTPVLLLRWGCTSPYSVRYDFDNLIDVQSPAAIGLAANKPRARQFLADHGVSVPPTLLLPQPVDVLVERLGLPLIVRKPNHQGGRGFYFCETSEEVASACRQAGRGYAMSYIPKDREYRIHVGWTNAQHDDSPDMIFVQRKVVVDEDEWDRDSKVWNFAAGYRFHSRKPWRIPSVVLQTGIKAIDVLGLTYGAADVMYVEDTDTAYVSEVNTGPGLKIEISQDAYLNLFKQIIEREGD